MSAKVTPVVPTQAAEDYVPSWCALTKVCYRGGTANDPQKLEKAVQKREIFEAAVFETDWLKNPKDEKGLMLPLRHPQTRQPLFLMMASRDGSAPPIEPPPQVEMAYYPPDDLPVFPDNAPPGGKWAEERFCGPVTVCCACVPCCWLCALALGGGKPLDEQFVYTSPDGRKFNFKGKEQASKANSTEGGPAA